MIPPTAWVWPGTNVFVNVHSTVSPPSTSMCAVGGSTVVPLSGSVHAICISQPLTWLSVQT